MHSLYAILSINERLYVGLNGVSEKNLIPWQHIQTPILHNGKNYNTPPPPPKKKPILDTGMTIIQEIGGGGQSTSGSRDTTAPELLGQETGESGRMGGLTAYLLCINEEYGLKGRGEFPGAAMETGGDGEKYEGRVRRDLGNGKGAAGMGTWKAWRGQGRCRGGGYGQRRVRERYRSIGMLGLRQVTPWWEDDTVRRQDGRRWRGCRGRRGLPPLEGHRTANNP